VNRRAFLLSTAGAGIDGLLTPDRRLHAEPGTHGRRVKDRPNILVMMVDQLRYPSVFPASIGSVDAFLAQFMPNLYNGIWQNGVKFANHYTAASPCSPARSALVTGLYTHQTWILQNLKPPHVRPDRRRKKGSGGKPGHRGPPSLNSGFPTFGKLLRQAGYHTPYIGKWHLSDVPQFPPRLEEYGFTGLTWPDPIGGNLHATVGEPGSAVLNDQDLANQAIAWLASNAAEERLPWCLTVSFLNPHDIQFFWDGTEYKRFDDLFSAQQTYRSHHDFSHDHWPTDPLRDPPSYGYPKVPPNWESAEQIARNKPPAQASYRLLTQFGDGGASDDPRDRHFSIVQLRGDHGIGVAPYSYWQRSLDCYTLLMSIVDNCIGQVLDAIPTTQRQNTIIVFTSDHGNYASAHGFLTGKTGSLYDEAYHVPLIVSDPTGQFTADIDTPRTGLTSSVDFLPMLVGLGNRGSTEWQTGDLAALYRNRLDLIAMLQSADAPGRPFVLLAGDQVSPKDNGFEKHHLLGFRTEHFKLGTYARWRSHSTALDMSTLETEFYDYRTAAGQAETHSTPDAPEAASALDYLLSHLVPNDLQAPLPDAYADTGRAARNAYLHQDRKRADSGDAEPPS
jgi:arylsulfatase A-like enzyme